MRGMSNLISQFAVTREDLSGIVSVFQSEMRRGLAGDPRSIAMNPSFVARPSGSERGRFVTLDLGGTNVRATVVEIGGGALKVLKHDSFRLASPKGTSSDLFDPIARFLGHVLDDDVEYSLGFIFAYPMNQTGIRSGSLSKWTKELNFSGVAGKDAVDLLELAVADAADAFPVLRRLTVSALANDTVGVLAAGAYLDPRCDMGLIVGTGANMAVAVPTNMLGGHLPSAPGRLGEMIINMECGNFDGVRHVQTTNDRRLDAESDTEGQLIEKMVSGRYLGETARLAVLDSTSNGEGFEGWLDGSSAFNVPYAFTTEYISDMAFDESEDLTATAMLLGSLGVADSTLDDRRRLRDLAAAVARRSAHLVAATIAATVTYIDPNIRNDHIVAADGSVIRGYPGYQAEVRRGLQDILGHRAELIQIVYLRDGSGLGAAVVAAVAASVST